MTWGHFTTLGLAPGMQMAPPWRCQADSPLLSCSILSCLDSASPRTPCLCHHPCSSSSTQMDIGQHHPLLIPLQGFPEGLMKVLTKTPVACPHHLACLLLGPRGPGHSRYLHMHLPQGSHSH